MHADFGGVCVGRWRLLHLATITLQALVSDATVGASCCNGYVSAASASSARTSPKSPGAAAARTMLSHVLGPVDDVEAQAPFELFAHVTRFLGWRVTMLGVFNGQGLNAAECEAIVRVTKGVE